MYLQALYDYLFPTRVEAPVASKGSDSHGWGRKMEEKKFVCHTASVSKKYIKLCFCTHPLSCCPQYFWQEMSVKLVSSRSGQLTD